MEGQHLGPPARSSDIARRVAPAPVRPAGVIVREGILVTARLPVGTAPNRNQARSLTEVLVPLGVLDLVAVGVAEVGNGLDAHVVIFLRILGAHLIWQAGRGRRHGWGRRRLGNTGTLSATIG